MRKEEKISAVNWLVKHPDYYQSATSSNEAIKNNFIIRIAEFELITDDLKNKENKDPLQHELVLGHRGSGKSTLLKRIQVEIEENPVLSSKYIAINLAEEQAGIYRLFDLWLEVLKELIAKNVGTLPSKDYADFDTVQDYTRYLYEIIHEALRSENRKVVLLLDNFDRIVENLHNDGNLLRESLLNYNDFQIIGGSTRMNEHFWRYDKPFYDFFRRHTLKALSSEEIHRLLNHWGVVMDLPQLTYFAQNNPGKIEAIRIMTDGFPRTLQFFIQVLVQDTTLYGFDYVRKVMDNVTPLYQERLNHLAPSHRKIVLEMSFLWEACSVKQLVEKCNMQGKLLSAQLKQLSNNGIVETITTSKKNHLYRLSERFFNMWLIVTQGNPDQKRRVKWLTLFLETWYDAQQLKALALEHIVNLQSKKIPLDKAVFLTKALSQSRYIGTTERDKMLDYTIGIAGSSSNAIYLELPEKYSDILRKVEKLAAERDFKKVHAILDEIENEDGGDKFNIKAIFYAREGRKEEAKEYYLQAIGKRNLAASYNLAKILSEEGQKKEAEQQYLLAIEKGYNNALLELASFYAKEGQSRGAEQYYLRAIEKGYDDALLGLASLYANEGRNKEAEQYLLRAIEKNNNEALLELAFFYFVNNINGKESVQLIKRYRECNKNQKAFLVQILIEVWNGILVDLEEKVLRVVEENVDGDLWWFFCELIVFEQTTIVHRLFSSSIHCKELQARYTLLYYVLLLLDSSSTEAELRIPPEVMSTLQGVMNRVKQRRLLYSVVNS